MQTTNDRMTEEQVTDLLNLAAELQAKAEASNDRDTAVMAYAVQKVCLELTESRLKSKASEQQLAAVVAENAGMKKRTQQLVDVINKADNDYCMCGDAMKNHAHGGCGHPTGMFDYHYGKWLESENENPATDAFLAEVRAQGVEMFVSHMDYPHSPYEFTHGYMDKRAIEFAAQLRQGAAL